MNASNHPYPPMPSIKDLKLVKKIEIQQAKEQIQEDILSCLEAHDCSFRVKLADDLCQIVVDNFKTLDS